MALQFSVAARKAKFNGGLRTALNGQPSGGTGPHTMLLKVYSGTVPASADASIGSATLLNTYVNGATGLSFADPTLVSGQVVMKKTGSETWTGTAVASGTPTFWRLTEANDVTTDETNTYVRVQGTCSIVGAGDMNLSAVITIGAVHTIDDFTLVATTY